MFRASLCPSSGEQDRVLLHRVFCTGCAGCGCVELGRKQCATQLTTQLTCITAYGAEIPYAVIHGLVHLMMGIMMPETCWDRSLIINIGLVASCWFISFHPTFHDARSQGPKITNSVKSLTCDNNSFSLQLIKLLRKIHYNILRGKLINWRTKRQNLFSAIISNTKYLNLSTPNYKEIKKNKIICTVLSISGYISN